MGSSRGCESHMQMKQPSVKKVFCVILHCQNSLNELQQTQIEEDLKINFSLCPYVTNRQTDAHFPPKKSSELQKCPQTRVLEI